MEQSIQKGPRTCQHTDQYDKYGGIVFFSPSFFTDFTIFFHRFANRKVNVQPKTQFFILYIFSQMMLSCH